MSERDWLGGLQMGEAGHDRFRFAFRDIDQRGLQAAKFRDDRIGFFTQIQTDVGCNLIVTLAPGVQLLASLADTIGEF